MGQIDNLQILIDTLQQVKQEEIEREQDNKVLYNRLA